MPTDGPSVGALSNGCNWPTSEKCGRLTTGAQRYNNVNRFLRREQKGALEMNLVRLGCCILAAAVSCSAQQAAEKIEFFERRIRPVLTSNCYTCHTDTKLGGLQVNSRVALLT